MSWLRRWTHSYLGQKLKNTMIRLISAIRLVHSPVAILCDNGTVSIAKYDLILLRWFSLRDVVGQARATRKLGTKWFRIFAEFI
jgi:hypothetical protein